MMRKLYQRMVFEQNQIKGDNLVQIGGIKKNKEKELALPNKAMDIVRSERPRTVPGVSCPLLMIGGQLLSPK
jgi:hypothetical protein